MYNKYGKYCDIFFTEYLVIDMEQTKRDLSTRLISVSSLYSFVSNLSQEHNMNIT